MSVTETEYPAPNSLALRPSNGPRAHLSMKLRDGRRFGYSDIGPPQATPVFYFHGYPGSRLEATFFPVAGIRLIGIDRPGYGLSSPQHNRRLADIASDIAQLADHLGLARFSLLGVSGGAPYAMASAYMLGSRVASVALLCGLGPPEAPGMNEGRLGMLTGMGARRFTRLGAAMLGRRVVLSDWALGKLREARAQMPRVSADKALMDGAFGHLMSDNWREGLARSSHGFASDARIYAEPWPFGLEEITQPTALWHGEADTIVPPAIGRYYASRIARVDAHFPAEEGHLSVIVNNIATVGAFLASHD